MADLNIWYHHMDTRSALHVRPETDAAGIPEFHPLPYPDDNSEEPPQSADIPHSFLSYDAAVNLFL